MDETKKLKPSMENYSSAGPPFPGETITDKLETAYAALRNRYDGLDQELRMANNTLMDKIQELNFFTGYLNSILSHISQGLLFINTSGVVTTYNPAAETTLHKPQKDVLFLQFWHSFSDTFFGFSLKEVLQKKKGPESPITIQVEFQKGDPRELEVNSSFVAKARPGQQDPLEGLIVLVKDVTEFRKLEQIAQRKNRLNALGEMASMVAHEIRNPLGGIKGFASLLEKDLADRPDLQKMAAYILKGTDNLNTTVTRILDYSRPLQMQVKMTDLTVLLNDLKLHLLTDENVAGKAEILIECIEKHLHAPIDTDSMRSALLNLVFNAVQAMPQGGKIVLSLSQDATQAIIEIKDSGIGIPPDNLKKIFSLFFTTRSDGNGFGLAEVQKAVQAHDGTISVDSVVDQGTTFTIKLPLKRKASDVN